MKRKYETPVVIAEMYKANAYCGACDMSKNGELFTNAEDAYRNASLDPWTPDLGITAGNLSHTFPKDPSFYSTGNCTNNHTDKSQPIWRCNCTNHGKEVWYLEWSHYYSVDNSQLPGDVYFLYKDDGDGEFEILKNSTNFPAKESGRDTNVALVNYGVTYVQMS